MSERKINLKDNIYIEGFDNSLYLEVWRNCDRNPVHWKNIIYSGLTSKIPEDLAKKCVIAYYLGSNFRGNHEHSEFGYLNNKQMFATAFQTIQSACNKPYCVIYKI